MIYHNVFHHFHFIHGCGGTVISNIIYMYMLQNQDLRGVKLEGHEVI